MAANAAAVPFLHNTKAPLECCDRCHRAELLGRAMKRPVFRYDKVVDGPGAYEMFHGDLHVATFTRRRVGVDTFYGVQARWDPSAEESRASTLKDARVSAEQTYTDGWRQGQCAARGPVLEL
jgi:hypothetical protein